MLDLDALNFEKGQGLLTVVAQDARTGAVLMVAHADRDALERTIRTGEMHYRSRTRGQWHKGATSGNVQRVVSLSADCDGDAVLARVLPAGPACHTGAASCFGTGALYADALSSLDATVLARQQSRAREEPNSETSYSETSYSETSYSETSYTRRLLADRNLRLKKLGEESAELVTACADGDASRATQEAADLVYHAIVALHALGASLDDVRAVLAARAARAARAAHPS